MSFAKPFKNTLFTTHSPAAFEELALKLFRYQAQHNPVYARFLHLLGREAGEIHTLREIPFLPISFFKSHEVLSGEAPVQHTFLSSGTTGAVASKHPVSDLSLYEESYRKGFQHFYGAVEDYCVLALLPSYLERQGSSLVYMCEGLIKKSGHPDSGFYLYELDALAELLKKRDAQGQRILLIGVTYALLDLIEKGPFQLRNTIVMETGGMKGRRKELVRAELHDLLGKGFGLENIHSEYGMTELLSQAYSKGKGIFQSPPWMRVLTRSTTDPLYILEDGRSGGLNSIDLANVNSCAFIATQDLGKVYPDGSFEVLGRFDHSDIRGCNLMLD